MSSKSYLFYFVTYFAKNRFNLHQRSDIFFHALYLVLFFTGKTLFFLIDCWYSHQFTNPDERDKYLESTYDHIISNTLLSFLFFLTGF